LRNLTKLKQQQQQKCEIVAFFFLNAFRIQ
jgi:hypothetical protein